MLDNSDGVVTSVENEHLVFEVLYVYRGVVQRDRLDSWCACRMAFASCSGLRVRIQNNAGSKADIWTNRNKP